MTDPMLRWVAALAACGLAATLAMVRFTMALVDEAPSRRDRVWWAAAYAASWLGIVYYIHHIPPDAGPVNADPTWISVAAAAGSCAFHALWLQFWFAIGRARLRDGFAAPMPADFELLCARARQVAVLSAALLVIALARLNAFSALLERALAPGRRASSIALTAAAAGFGLFIVGGVRLALYSGGAKRFTFTDLRDAWHRRAWRRDPGWLSAFLMLSGVAAGVAGGLSAAVMMGDGTTRGVIAVFCLYGAFQAWRGSRRRTV